MSRTAKPSRWFRMYAEFANDPKVQSLSETDQRRFLMVLCLRCSNGDVTLHDADIAFSLRIDVDSWCQTKQIFLDRKLIDKRNRPTAWDRRQFASDSSAERVSRHRAKSKSNGGANGDVTLQKRQANALEAEAEESIPPTPKGAGDVFARFWSAYPRKIGKGAAEKAWSKAKINGHADAVIAAVEQQRSSEQWQKDGGQYIPNPATWLNQRRWEDELVAGQAPSGNSLFAGAI